MAAPILRFVAVAWLVCWSVPDSVARASGRELEQSAFNVGTAKMPARFRGNTVEWVIRYGTLAPRFETSAEYAVRRRAFRSEVFAFVPDRHESKYDRAAETMVISIPSVTTHLSTRRGDASTATAFNIHRTKLSAATRAGPATWSRDDRPVAADRGAVLSTRRAWKQTQLVMSDDASGVSPQALVFTLRVPRERAAALKSKLRVALVSMPLFDQYEPAGDDVVHEATGVDFATDGSAQFMDENTTYLVALRCNLLQVWLFDYTTGEVYGRFTPQGVPVPRD